MPNEKDKPLAETLIDFVLEDKAEHQAVMATLPAEKLAAAVGRKGKLTIEGPDGGVFIIKLTPYGVFKDDSPGDLRNEVWMTDATFQDIVIGELEPRTARARGQVLFKGDRSLYDAAEIIDVFEKWMLNKIRPLAQKMMKAMVRKKA